MKNIKQHYTAYKPLIGGFSNSFPTKSIDSCRKSHSIEKALSEEVMTEGVFVP